MKTKEKALKEFIAGRKEDIAMGIEDFGILKPFLKRGKDKIKEEIESKKFIEGLLDLNERLRSIENNFNIKEDNWELWFGIKKLKEKNEGGKRA